MERLNPFFKAVSVLVLGLMLSFSNSLLVNLGIVLFCVVAVLFFSKVKLSSCLKGIAPAVLGAVSIFYTGLMFTDQRPEVQEVLLFLNLLHIEGLAYDPMTFYNALRLSFRVLAYASLGLLFAFTTDGEEFVMSLMHQGKLAPKYAYGVLASFHLLPLIREELNKTRLAYKVRGIPVHWYSIKPLFSMLVNTIHWSDSVAMAMEAKGFCGDGKRTHYKVTHVRWYDWCFFGGTCMLLLFLIVCSPV